MLQSSCPLDALLSAIRSCIYLFIVLLIHFLLPLSYAKNIVKAWACNKHGLQCLSVQQSWPPTLLICMLPLAIWCFLSPIYKDFNVKSPIVCNKHDVAILECAAIKMLQPCHPLFDLHAAISQMNRAWCIYWFILFAYSLCISFLYTVTP